MGNKEHGASTAIFSRAEGLRNITGLFGKSAPRVTPAIRHLADKTYNREILGQPFQI